MTSLFKLLSGSGVRRVGMVPFAACLFLSAAAEAQTSRLQQAANKLHDYTTVFEAYERRTDLCQSYIGKTVTVTPFATLAQSLFTPSAQGEFETEEQYAGRLKAVADRVPTSPVIVSVSTDRDFITYYPDKDKGTMMIRVGAFGAFHYLDDIGLHTAEMIALMDARLENGARVLQNVSDRPIRTYVAKNGFGASIKVSEVERKANFVYLAQRPFPYVADDKTAILLVEDVPLVQAPQLKQTLRVALAVVPKAPYIFKHEEEGPVPTMQNPVQYKYKLTNLYADAKCGLVLNSQSRVLAAANAGS